MAEDVCVIAEILRNPSAAGRICRWGRRRLQEAPCISLGVPHLWKWGELLGLLSARTSAFLGNLLNRESPRVPKYWLLLHLGKYPLQTHAYAIPTLQIGGTFFGIQETTYLLWHQHAYTRYITWYLTVVDTKIHSIDHSIWYSLNFEATMSFAIMNAEKNGADKTINSRAYQLEMLDESLKGNVIVAVYLLPLSSLLPLTLTI